MKTAFFAVPVFALSVLVAGCSSGDSSIKSFASEEERIEAFCDLVSQGRALEESPEYADASLQVMTTMANATEDTDPAAIAAIHEWATLLYDMEEQLIPIYEELLSVTEDPQLRQAIEFTLDTTEGYGFDYARQLSEITSLSEFQDVAMQMQMEALESLSDPEDYQALTALDDYSIEKCGFPLSTENG